MNIISSSIISGISIRVISIIIRPGLDFSSQNIHETGGGRPQRFEPRAAAVAEGRGAASASTIAYDTIQCYIIDNVI